jgi:RNA polymerase sigma-70 factor (ECF subfamily)
VLFYRVRLTLDAPLSTSKPPAVDVRPDGEIVQAVIGGDRAAYALLVRRYERAVRATAIRVLHDPHLADDAAQEAFVAAYEALGKLREPSAFAAWLLLIARQRATRIAKKRERSLNDYPSSAGIAPSHGAVSSDDTEAILIAIDALPEHERVVVMLRYFEDHDVQSIGRILGRPTGTVTKQLSRAHERLRKRLQSEGQR